MPHFTAGTIMDVEVQIAHRAVAGFVLLVLAGAAASLLLLTRQAGIAILVGLALGSLHFLSGMVHQLSHALAARWTGHPMKTFRFERWLILATSIYPDDEPELPPAVHIRRAMGGPAGSLLFAALCAAAAILVEPWSRVAAALVAVAGLDSFLVFTLGSLLPLGFTDMSTLLRYRSFTSEKGS